MAKIATSEKAPSDTDHGSIYRAGEDIEEGERKKGRREKKKEKTEKQKEKREKKKEKREKRKRREKRGS